MHTADYNLAYTYNIMQCLCHNVYHSYMLLTILLMAHTVVRIATISVSVSEGQVDT